MSDQHHTSSTDQMQEINRKIGIAAKKRDHAVDVLGKPLLGLIYQQEIDSLLEQRYALIGVKPHV